MKNFHSFLLLLFFSNLCITQIQAQTTNSIPYIEVTGVKELEIVPDEIFIQFTLKERYEGKTKITIDQQKKKLFYLLKKTKIDLKNLSLTNANAGYVPVRKRKKDVLSSEDYILKVGTVKEISEVWNILDNVGAEKAYISKISHSNIENFQNQVKIDAVKNAKEKAVNLLGAIGEKIGNVLYIQEQNHYNPSYRTLNTRLLTKSSAESENIDTSEPEISFQKIKLRYSVLTRFSIKPQSSINKEK